MRETWEYTWSDYYKELDVSFDADEKSLKTSYRKLMQENHPDTNKGFEGYYEEKTKNLNEAYDVLSKPEKREKYNFEYRKRMNASVDAKTFGTTE